MEALCQSLVDLALYNALQTVADLAAAVRLQRSILLGDVMEQVYQVEDYRRSQLQDGQNPDNQGEEHTGQDHNLQIVVLSEDPEVVEELRSL